MIESGCTRYIFTAVSTLMGVWFFDYFIFGKSKIDAQTGTFILGHCVN